MVDIQRPFSVFVQGNQQSSVPRRVNSTTSVSNLIRVPPKFSDRFEGIVAPKPIKAFTSSPSLSLAPILAENQPVSSYSSPNLSSLSVNKLIRHVSTQPTAPLAISNPRINESSIGKRNSPKVGSLELDVELNQELRYSISLFSSPDEFDTLSRSGSVSPDNSFPLVNERPSLDSSPVSLEDDDSVCSTKSAVFGTPPSRVHNPLAYYCERSFITAGDPVLDLFAPSPVLEASQDNLPFEIEDIRI